MPCADAAMDSILKTIDERKFEEAAEVQATNDTLRAHWRMQTDRSLRPEWDITDPDTLKKVCVGVGVGVDVDECERGCGCVRIASDSWLV
jgi:hypothetical protein